MNIINLSKYLHMVLKGYASKVLDDKNNMPKSFKFSPDLNFLYDNSKSDLKKNNLISTLLALIVESKTNQYDGFRYPVQSLKNIINSEYWLNEDVTEKDVARLSKIIEDSNKPIIIGGNGRGADATMFLKFAYPKKIKQTILARPNGILNSDVLSMFAERISNMVVENISNNKITESHVNSLNNIIYKENSFSQIEKEEPYYIGAGHGLPILNVAGNISNNDIISLLNKYPETYFTAGFNIPGTTPYLNIDFSLRFNPFILSNEKRTLEKMVKKFISNGTLVYDFRGNIFPHNEAEINEIYLNASLEKEQIESLLIKDSYIKNVKKVVDILNQAIKTDSLDIFRKYQIPKYTYAIVKINDAIFLDKLKRIESYILKRPELYGNIEYISDYLTDERAFQVISLIQKAEKAKEKSEDFSLEQGIIFKRNPMEMFEDLDGEFNKFQFNDGSEYDFNEILNEFNENPDKKTIIGDINIIPDDYTILDILDSNNIKIQQNKEIKDMMKDVDKIIGIKEIDSPIVEIEPQREEIPTRPDSQTISH